MLDRCSLGECISSLPSPLSVEPELWPFWLQFSVYSSASICVWLRSHAVTLAGVASRDRDHRRDRGQSKDTQNHPTHAEPEQGLAGENQEASLDNQGSQRREEEENRDRAGQRKRTHPESESGTD